ncbi:hypothetical protein BELL_0306g00090 [Botrytis elliptica]|uniref:Uncharacterized protein n=1 Tax=Botrytis elliptica TaxID=278938 RepID=A0A4Z1JKE1_9HELO|nr:hypothetical protein BELL_0306g00090 [Botrytis elliptica]
MTTDSPSFKWRAQASLDTLTLALQDVQSILKPQIEAGDASVLEYILNVEIPRFRSVYTTSDYWKPNSYLHPKLPMASNKLPVDGTRPKPPFFDKAPPEDILQFFQSFTSANDKQPLPTAARARTKIFDLVKPKHTFNRVQKQKRAKLARAPGIKSYILLLKSRENERFPLGSDGQPPFVRLPVALLLNSSTTFKHLVEAKRQRLLDDRWDGVCYNPRTTQLKKAYLTEFTVYIDALIEGTWAKQKVGYAELAALGKEIIWDLIVMWSNILKGGSDSGQGEEDKGVGEEDLINLAILGKFLDVEEEFFKRLRKVENGRVQ